MGAGAAGALAAGGLAVAASRGGTTHLHPTAGRQAEATPSLVYAHGTPPPMLSLRPRLAEGSLLAQLAMPGVAPLRIVEGMPARAGMLGHDVATAYPGEPHSMLLVAGSGLRPPAPADGSELTVTATYGVYRYRVVGTEVVAPAGTAPAEIPGLRLVVPVSGGLRITTAALQADDPETQAELAQETAVAEAQAALAASGGGLARGAGQLLWPASGPLTQGFGPTSLSLEFPYVYQGVAYPHFHTGIDIGIATGTPVGAAADGIVVLAGTNVVGGRVVGYGTYVVIAHGDGLYTLYGHLSQLAVSAGQHVRAGQVIGLSGSTGNSTGPHLHFEVRQGSEPVDPLPYLP